jgi:hypothetical protein
MLWERGFLDGTNRGRDIYDASTIGGKKNGIRGRIEGSGLSELVSSQPNFVNEVTLYQYFTEQRSVPADCQLTLIRSRKCHPELAGEGIEYCMTGVLPNNGIVDKNLLRSGQKTSFENWSSKVSTK